MFGVMRRMHGAGGYELSEQRLEAPNHQERGGE